MLIALKDENATARFGEDIARALRAGDFVALEGDLGMGKSTLARALIRSLADDPALEVPSPTFTLAQSYQARIPAWHFDFYRLSSAEELPEIGFDEARDAGIAIVEWPERAGDAIGRPTLLFRLSENGAGRDVSVSGDEEALDRLARSLAIREFLDGAGWQGAWRRHFSGDASTRAYETVSLPGRADRILMNAPRQPDGPPIRDGLPYSRIAHLAETVTPFVAVARALTDAGLAAPAIEAADLDRGLLLIEHLGGEGILDDAGVPIAERYIAAAQTLAFMHDRDWPAVLAVDGAADYALPAYDEGAMAIETELLTDWYMEHFGKGGADAREAYREAWREQFGALDGAERSIVLRDYHSPNIIWRGALSGTDRIGIIDFQDAVLGPAAYDVASLGMDARVTIEPELEARIVDAYCAARRRPGFDATRFRRDYAVMAAQRNSKILGIFVRLDRRDGKPQYLKHLPRIRAYLARALAHPELGRLRALYERLGVFPDAA